MYVRAIRDFETASHNVSAGMLVDLPDDQALEAINSGDAAEVATERAIASMSGVETATNEPRKASRHAENDKPNQADREPSRGKAPHWAK